MSNVLTVFQNKNKGETSTYDNHAIITDPQFEPFLLTMFDLFFISPSEVNAFFATYKAKNAFNKRKRRVAIIFLILALPMAIFYLLSSMKMISFDVPDIALILAKEEIFLASLFLLILWNDLATNYDAKETLINYPNLDDYTINTVDSRGVEFTKYSLKKPLDYFHPSATTILADSLIRKDKKRIVDTQKLLIDILSQKHVGQILKRLDIENIKHILQKVKLSSDDAPEYPYIALQSLILYATEQAIKTKSKSVYPEHILLSLFEAFPILKDTLQTNKVDFLTFIKTIEWYIINDQYAARTNAFDLDVPYYEKGGVADGWVKGFTFYLDKISHDVIENVIKKGGIYGIGHEKEINTLIGVLQKQIDSNSLLVGDPGTGKSSIILGLAQRIAEGQVPRQLNRLSIKEIDLNKLLALASSGRGGLPELIQKISNELKKQTGTILYFDDLESLLSTGAGQGTAISYLMPLFIDSPVPIVGTMTFSQYSQLKSMYPTLLDSFKEIRIDPLNKEDTFTILTSKVNQLERLHKIKISFPALHDILNLTEQYQPNKKFPKKAVELLEQAAVQASNKSDRKLTRELVTHVAESLTDIPIIHSSPEEAEKLLSLETKIHQRYVNQSEAVIAVVDSLQRAKTQVRDTTKPFGVFLFLGPSGVGKTELAKITAEEYFGGNFSLIRIDLSQIKSDRDIPNIMDQLKKVSLRPYTLLLLDEFEKTLPSIHDIFMRLFDEGVVVTHKDETLYFNNTIIIATSNIGSDLLLNTAQADFDMARQKVISMLPEYLKIELINRFDKILVFESLTMEHLKQITVLKLTDLVNKLGEQGIQTQYTDKTVEFIAKSGFHPGMGARPLNRAIKDILETRISKLILETQSNTGQNPNIIDFDSLLSETTINP